jgi:cysteinyl-tRNA synthetase
MNNQNLLSYLVNTVLDYRDVLRLNGHFEQADKIRNDLKSFGVKVQDGNFKDLNSKYGLN